VTPKVLGVQRARSSTDFVPLGNDVESQLMTTSDLEGHVRAICMELPEVTERRSHGSPAFFVKKQFVVLMTDGHHEHHFAHMWCAALPEVQQALIAMAPDRIFR